MHYDFISLISVRFDMLVNQRWIPNLCLKCRSPSRRLSRLTMTRASVAGAGGSEKGKSALCGYTKSDCFAPLLCLEGGLFPSQQSVKMEKGF